MLEELLELVLRITMRASPTFTFRASSLLLDPKACPARVVEAHAVTAAIVISEGGCKEDARRICELFCGFCTLLKEYIYVRRGS